MDISAIVGEKVTGTDYTGEPGEFRISLDVGNYTLYVSANGSGEIDLRATLDRDETPVECIGKTVSAIDYEEGVQTCYLTLEFDDGSKLEFKAGGREEVCICADYH